MPVALTIALAAFLTFQVQFILGRALLPHFGGTPAVWTTSLLFFQVALLVGYAWAHQVAQRPLRTQVRLHLGFVGLATLVLFAPSFIGTQPLLASVVDAGSTRAPALAVCSALLFACGLPFVALAATSPLLQAWAVREATARGDTRPVQRLYAVSNLGSLLGLLSYPFIFERWLDLDRQAWLWCATYVVCVGSLVVCGRRVARLVPSEAAPVRTAPATATPPGSRAASVGDTGRFGEFALWLLLPAAGSALMLSVSNSICQDVAVIPMMWVAPLAVYLATYILPFRSLRWVPRNVVAVIAAVGCASALLAVLWSETVGAYGYIAVQLVLLGGLGLLLHGEVARLAPVGPRLPTYYLTLAAGGALGGAFVSLAAPAWFRGYWELPITLVAAWLCVLGAWWRDRASPLRGGGWWGPAVLLGVAGIVLGALLASAQAPVLTFARTPATRLFVIGVGLAAGLAVGAGLGGFVRRLRHGFVSVLAVIALLLLVESLMVADIARGNRRLIARERNFFGVVRVVENGKPGSPAERRELVHGWITHGVQLRDPVLRRVPTSYYAGSTGAARSIALLRDQRRGQPLRLGAVGLGAGTIATLTRPGDRLRFYEINPAVIRLAQGDAAQFTFLADAPAAIEIAEGDGRQELRRELAAGHPGKFDVLLLDAFSSDAVPAHLLTLEAFELYREHAAPEGGLIAVHITNRYLELGPLMVAVARHFGWEVQRFASDGDAPIRYASQWMVFATKPGLLPAPLRMADIDAERLPAPWTDRFSSLLPVLR